MTDFPDRPGYSFSPGPPPEASRYLKNKGLRPGFAWEDVEPEEHAVAFTVAKAMQIDVLEAIREEVQKALDDGLPLASFRKSLRPRLEKLGWWGKQDVVDPETGETVEAWLGSPRRLRTIYDANLRTARAAGQWERIDRTRKLLPYLEYRLGPSENHRPHHKDKEGLILPVEDPFWDEWMPPNGWGCKCWVKQITRAEAERKGVRSAPKVRDKVWENPRTGAVALVPEGIDPGWQRNPGKLRLQAVEAVLAGKIEALPEAAARAAVLDIVKSWRAERVLLGKAPGAVPVAVLPAEVAAAFGTGTRVVSMTGSYGDKFAARNRDVTTGTLLILDEALRTGIVIVETPADGTQTRLHVFSRGDKVWQFVIAQGRKAAEIWVRTIHRARPSRARAVARRPGSRVVRE
ncbi:phage minor head protein [Albidovulum sp.]|uniref:phage head morphogenesis protein n=1 Tax=Albidovulum sp. TaxID=1872424 RepID=UPI0039B99EE6